ncbi:MAG: hypothetical protein M1838_000954 [Thelocarpon superellum]|nr:MAG: hypothetical protein M1838_000954 [Thelocarpon superellum]
MARIDDTPQIIPTLSPPSIDFPGARSSTDSSGAWSDLDEARHAPPRQSRPFLQNRSLTTARDFALRPSPLSRLTQWKTSRSTGRHPTSRPSSSSSSSSSSSTSLSSSEDEAATPSPSTGPSNKDFKGSAGNAARKTRSSNPGVDTARFSRFSVGNTDFKTRGRVSKHDGRLKMSVNETTNNGYLAKALGATLKNHLGGSSKQDATEGAQGSTVQRIDTQASSPSRASAADVGPIPQLNIVIMVIGSRGDIQPFLKIGKILKEAHGHRVRIATHPAFKKFVERDSGLEFFSVGGDPSELMAFMVKNPGLIPSLATVKAGEIGRRREAMFGMFQGFWRACINATDEETDVSNRRMMADKHPFVADAIIANPPSFAHVHCAERLGVPLHLMFTFPYSPTQSFPHPLANIKKTNMDMNYTNFMSYPLVEMMTWQGLGDLINRFRVQTLQLEPVSTLWAPGQLYRLKVPYTYLWSPGLVPKPEDWGPEIDIAGFVFLDLASSFEPPDGLRRFLEAGPPPVYIGFGSIVVDDPEKFTAMIFEAVAKAGVRALVSKGWGGLGEDNPPENIYLLENTPHDWLFPKVSAVVHHGGAGTTAIGLKCGRPTMIVPFFGDQPFWGAMIARSGAGAREAIPYKALNADRLAQGIRECLSPEAQANATKLADGIAREGDGARNAVRSFHRTLPLQGEHIMRCAILVDRVAVWKLKKTEMRLSALAATILVERGMIHRRDLRLIRHCAWNDFDGPGEPLTGGGAALVSSFAGVARGFGSVPVRWAKSVRRHERREQKRLRRAQARAKTSKHRARRTGSRVVTDDSTPSAIRDPAGADLTRSSTTTPTASNGNASTPKEKRRASDGIAADDAETESIITNGDDEHIVQDLATDAGRGLEASGQALAKAPMDLSLALAQGFHNAPRLYGDATVRRPHRITGFHSGMRAAGEELVYGVYDGVTGLVVQPYTGARDDGLIGLFKGVGKGFGGFVLKDLAALIGPFGYALKGLHKELQKPKQPTRFIRQARFVQGSKDLEGLDSAQRENVLRTVASGWQVHLELQSLGDGKKSQGLKSRIELSRERKRWRKHGAFENVNQARIALETKKQDGDVEKVLREQRDALASSAASSKAKAAGAADRVENRASSNGLNGHAA